MELAVILFAFASVTAAVALIHAKFRNKPKEILLLHGFTFAVMGYGAVIFATADMLPLLDSLMGFVMVVIFPIVGIIVVLHIFHKSRKGDTTGGRKNNSSRP